MCCVPQRAWFAVRCLFKMTGAGPSSYEERITLWQAGSPDEAIERAETEAVEYAEGIGEYLGLAQSFQLFDEPTDGSEVFSLIRDSDLQPNHYLVRFFSSGTERHRDYRQ